MRVLPSYKLGSTLHSADALQQMMELPTARKLHDDVIKVRLPAVCCVGKHQRKGALLRRGHADVHEL